MVITSGKEYKLKPIEDAGPVIEDEAVRTCTLSKRWQFIWTQILKVDFWTLRRSDLDDNDDDDDDDDEDEDEEIHKGKSWDWIGKMLAMCNYLKILNVRLSYGDFLPSNVDQWIQLAIKNKVKSITLDFWDPDEFSGDVEELDELYELPEEFYSCSSLTKLTLCMCVLAPQGILTWGSLIELRLEKVEYLFDSLMEQILSGCPVLEFLKLKACSGLNNLNINSPNLTTLEIKGFDDDIPNITAPYLRILRIDNWLKYQDCLNEHFMLKNLSSIVKVSLIAWRKLSTSESTINHMKQILQSLESAMTIELSSEHLKVISLLEVKGWKFPLFLQLRCLRVLMWTHEMSTIPAILALVRSSSNLEALKIDMIQHRKDIPSDKVEVSLHNYATDLVASHLKTVKIRLLNGRDSVNEYMLTLLPILLKSAKVLEEMTIKVDETKHDPLPPTNTLLDSVQIVERLLTFPISSSKAVIVPCS